jgi:hypothetical protein
MLCLRDFSKTRRHMEHVSVSRNRRLEVLCYVTFWLSKNLRGTAICASWLPNTKHKSKIWMLSVKYHNLRCNVWEPEASPKARYINILSSSYLLPFLLSHTLELVVLLHNLAPVT